MVTKMVSSFKTFPSFKNRFHVKDINRCHFPFNNFHQLVRDDLTPERHMAWKTIMEKKNLYVPLDTFKEVAIDSGQFAYRYTSFKRYTLHTPRPKLDHYVSEAMKEWDREKYKSLYGYTRKAHPDRMYYTILMYCAPIHRIPDQYREGFEIAKENIRKRLQPSKKLKFMDLSLMDKNIPLNTSVGYEFMDQRTKERKTKKDFLPQAKRIAEKRYWQIYKGEKSKSVPYTLAMRGHLTNFNELKSRPIWLAPFSTVLLENIMYRPIYDHIFKNCSDFIFTGKDTLARLNSFLNEYRNYPGDVSFINTDVSQWDRMRCRELTLAAFDIIESFYELDEGEKRLFDYLKWDFIKTNVCFPDGTVLQRSAGHSTGSLGILLLNSVVNSIAMECVLYHTVPENKVTLKKVLGDDYAFYFLDTIEKAHQLTKDMAVIMLDCFDLISKPEKMIVSGINDDRKFIGYQLKNGRLYKPEEELFRSMLHPETIIKSLKISFSRMLSYYLLLGCNNSNFVRFFQQYLGYYEEELRKLDSIYDSIVMKHGSLRIFKYVFHIDDSELLGMKFDDICKLDNINAPYLLLNNSKLIGVFSDYD